MGTKRHKRLCHADFDRDSTRGWGHRHRIRLTNIYAMTPVQMGAILTTEEGVAG
jgi:hypothetical protein